MLYTSVQVGTSRRESYFDDDSVEIEPLKTQRRIPHGKSNARNVVVGHYLYGSVKVSFLQ